MAEIDHTADSFADLVQTENLREEPMVRILGLVGTRIAEQVRLLMDVVEKYSVVRVPVEVPEHTEVFEEPVVAPARGEKLRYLS